MQIKVCGITSVDDALLAARAGADFIGLILAESPRRIDLDAARRIHAGVGERPSPVLVFRDAPLNAIIEAVEFTGCVWVQLHGGETPNDLALLKARYPLLRIIKAFELTRTLAAETIARFFEDARGAGAPLDALLLDRAKSGGAAADARFVEIAESLRPRPTAVWRAGGLTPASAEAVVTTGSFDGLDVSSGVEAAPGRKDPQAVLRFIAAAREAAARLAPERSS
jgi:phosphoribosylanthranilate isomerase